MRLPNIECGFRHLIHSKKERWFRVFYKMLLSLPKLAVKNNSSKKHAQMWAKNTLMVDFLAQGSRKVNETHQNPENFYASGVRAFTLSRLATRPLNISHVSRIIQWKNIIFSRESSRILSGSPHALDYISMPSTRLHDDCAVGLTTKLATCTQPINVNLQVESCQELLWKFTNAKNREISSGNRGDGDEWGSESSNLNTYCLSSGSSSEYCMPLDGIKQNCPCQVSQ